MFAIQDPMPDQPTLSEIARFTYFRGRVALAALLRALGVGKGDRVAIQAYTCVAVPEAIMAVGAVPVYVDIDADTLGMSAESLANVLATGPGPRAVVVQHTFGHPARMDGLMKVAGKHSLPVIEDCCHTYASAYDGRQTGTFGIGAFYSFEYGKPVVTGMGGGLRVNDPELACKIADDYANLKEPGRVATARVALQRRLHHSLYRPEWYWAVRDAFHSASKLGLAKGNYNPIGEANTAEDFSLRMVPGQSALLEEGLGQIEVDAVRRRALAGRYTYALAGAPVQPVKGAAAGDPVLVRFPLRVGDKKAALGRARHAGLELAGWYETPIHPLRKHELDKVHYVPGSCPVAEAGAKDIVTLPMSNKVSARFVERIAALLQNG